MSSDAAWLAGLLDADLADPSLSREQIRARITEAAGLGLHGVVVDPTQVSGVPDTLVSTAVVGYPTGRHHSLIKASEARLAVEQGAEVIWLAVDASISEANAHLADIVAVRQAVPPPVQLGVISGGDHVIEQVAATAGADFTVIRAESTAEAVIEAIENGATRVAVADPAAVLAGITSR